MTKDTFYFKHDLNARGDQKIIRLRISSGWEGYGIYWAIIEKMYEEGGPLDDDLESLAFDLKADIKTVKIVCESPGLFYKKNGEIGSASVDRRMEHRKEVSAARASAGSIGGKAKAIAKQLSSNCLAKSSKDRIVDDNRLDDNKIEDKKDNGRIIPPKLEWVKDFCIERKNGLDADKFMAYYESNGWKVGKNPMRSWKAAIRGTWEKNNGGLNENRNQEGNARNITGEAAHITGKYSNI